MFVKILNIPEQPNYANKYIRSSASEIIYTMGKGEDIRILV